MEATSDVNGCDALPNEESDKFTCGSGTSSDFPETPPVIACMTPKGSANDEVA